MSGFSSVSKAVPYILVAYAAILTVIFVVWNPTAHWWRALLAATALAGIALGLVTLAFLVLIRIKRSRRAHD